MNKERWIAHNQDCRPARLGFETLVDVCFMDGQVIANEIAGWWLWGEEKPAIPDIIIGYRIVEGSDK